MNNDYLTTEQAAALLGCHSQTIRRLYAEGLIKAKRKVKPILRFRRSELEAFKRTYRKRKHRTKKELIV